MIEIVLLHNAPRAREQHLQRHDDPDKEQREQSTA